MTHSTEQARAEFEKIMRNEPSFKPELMVWDGGRYELDVMESGWQGFLLGIKAARRAQVVPVWCAPVTASIGTTKRAQEDGWNACVAAMLAAAPQPPEAGLMSEKRTTKPEAAPVQMPEPEAWRYTTTQRRSYAYRGARKDFDKEYPILKPEPLYTEHQVRQLLAAHGVK